MPQNNKATESGNVFIFILLGIVLFAALSFSIARGFRSNNTTALSSREAELTATDILTYAQRIERAVNKLRRNGCSENEISFENPTDAAYTFATRDKCKVFGQSGGKLSFTPPPQDAGNVAAIEWRFSGIPSIQSSTSTSGDLSAFVDNLNLQTCLAINKNLGISPAGDTPVDASAVTLTKFVGTYGTGTPPNNEDASIQNTPTGCVNMTTPGTYLFYSMLIDR